MTELELKKIHQTLSLLNSMVNGGEQHSKQSVEMCKEAFAIVKNCNLHFVSGSALDFYTDLMKLINAYCDKGLKKPDLVHKMEYATRSCKLS